MQISRQLLVPRVKELQARRPPRLCGLHAMRRQVVKRVGSLEITDTDSFRTCLGMDEGPLDWTGEGEGEGQDRGRGSS